MGWNGAENHERLADGVVMVFVLDRVKDHLCVVYRVYSRQDFSIVALEFIPARLVFILLARRLKGFCRCNFI